MGAEIRNPPSPGPLGAPPNSPIAIPIPHARCIAAYGEPSHLFQQRSFRELPPFLGPRASRPLFYVAPKGGRDARGPQGREGLVTPLSASATRDVGLHSATA